MSMVKRMATSTSVAPFLLRSFLITASRWSATLETSLSQSVLRLVCDTLEHGVDLHDRRTKQDDQDGGKYEKRQWKSHLQVRRSRPFFGQLFDPEIGVVGAWHTEAISMASCGTTR
jgi:hypothetical protein